MIELLSGSVLLYGWPGVGKSILVCAAAALAAQRGQVLLCADDTAARVVQLLRAAGAPLERVHGISTAEVERMGRIVRGMDERPALVILDPAAHVDDLRMLRRTGAPWLATMPHPPTPTQRAEVDVLLELRMVGHRQHGPRVLVGPSRSALLELAEDPTGAPYMRFIGEPGAAAAALPSP